MDSQPIVIHSRFAPRVIDGGRSEAIGVEDPPALTRPSDRFEGWSATEASVLRVRAAARRASIPLTTALVIVVERALIGLELADRGLARHAAHLDAIASRTTVTKPLSDGLSEYLRALYDGGSAHEDALPSLVPIPMRLTERVLAVSVDELLRPDLLPSALVWERAAVACGLTMTEWATSALLDLVNG